MSKDSLSGPLNELRSGLANAPDRKVTRILAVVDAVGDTALNNALLEPLRPRLAVMKPARPLRFARLLFLPLDPLTVPTHAWSGVDPTLPRACIAPLARVARAGLGQAAREVERMIAGQDTGAEAVIRAAGRLLWPNAAETLAAATPPADWSETGLPSNSFTGLATGVAAVLRRAAHLYELA